MRMADIEILRLFWPCHEIGTPNAHSATWKGADELRSSRLPLESRARTWRFLNESEALVEQGLLLE